MGMGISPDGDSLPNYLGMGYDFNGVVFFADFLGKAVLAGNPKSGAVGRLWSFVGGRRIDQPVDPLSFSFFPGMAAVERAKGIESLVKARCGGTSAVHDRSGSLDRPELSRIWKNNRAAFQFRAGIVAREKSRCVRYVISNVASPRQ